MEKTMAINKYKTKRNETRYKATFWRDGKPIQSKSFKRKIDADEWLKRESLKRENELVGRLKGTSVSLSDFFDNVYIPNAGVRESTKKDYVRMFNKNIRTKFGDWKLISIIAEDWASLFNSLKQKGVSNARLNRIHAVASAIYTLGIRWRYVSSNPLMLIQWEKESLSSEHNYWNERQLSQFLNWAFENSPDLFPLYKLMYETGLRISEALALQWDCINLERDVFEVRRTYSRIMKQIESTTKSNHKRTLRLNSSSRETIHKLNNERRSKFVFSKKTGEMLAYETLRVRFLKDQKLAEVPEIGIHGLRHTFASHFMMNGGNIYDLMILMGHSDIQTTMRYAHLSSAHLANKSELVRFDMPKLAEVIELRPSNHNSTIIDEKKSSAVEDLKLGV